MKRTITLAPADHPMFEGKANICFVPRKPTREEINEFLPPEKKLPIVSDEEFKRGLEEHMRQTAPGMPTLSWWVRALDRLLPYLKVASVIAFVLLMFVVTLWMWQWVPCDQPTTLTWGHSHCELFGGIPNWLLWFLQWPF